MIVFPPPLMAWLIVHPFIETWRKFGVRGAYVIVCAIVVLGMIAIWSIRRWALTAEFGSNWLLLALSVAPFAGAIYIGVRRAQAMKTSTLFGLAEIKGSRKTGDLVTDGIYAEVRHPRYVEGFLVLCAVALFTNYLAMYVVTAVSVPVILLVVIAEERELLRRFGRDYEEYCARVPRFIPKIFFQRER